MDPEKVAAVRQGPEAEGLSETERNVLRFADGMTATPSKVDGAVFEALRRELGDEGLVELAAAVATENFSSRFNRAFEIEAQGLAQRKTRRG